MKELQKEHGKEEILSFGKTAYKIPTTLDIGGGKNNRITSVAKFTQKSWSQNRTERAQIFIHYASLKTVTALRKYWEHFFPEFSSVYCQCLRFMKALLYATI